MKELKKTYVGAAVFFERLADDGWPEDAGGWPERIGGCPLHTTIHWPNTNVQEGARFSFSHLIQSVLRIRNRA